MPDRTANVDHPVTFLDVGSGAGRRRIACITSAAAATRGHVVEGLVWLPGFKSEMVGSKATAIAAFAGSRGLAMTRFDYSGHGRSEGSIETSTLGDWVEEARAVFTQFTHGPQIVLASSMGGNIALVMLRQLMKVAPEVARRIRSMILIAPAWDMTERLMWQRFSAAVREQIEREGVYRRPSAYGDGDYPITKRLIEEGRAHLLGGSRFDPGRPIRIVHGLLDPDVPWEHTLDLVSELEGDWTHVTAVPDGDHRLSRPEDLELLLRIIDDEIAAVDRA